MLNTEIKKVHVRVFKPKALFNLISANEFTLQELTDIYNQTRVDYVVPMPMNKAKMQEYIETYDIDLSQSVVSEAGGKPFGVAMLGLRGEKAWLTRLGITPYGRKKGVGRVMTKELIRRSRKMGAKSVALEVIKNNLPARRLFDSLKFQPWRELLVIRRAPTSIDPGFVEPCTVTPLGYEDALRLIQTRTDTPSWVTDNSSLHNAGNLSALVARWPDGSEGWLVYQNTVFQLSRFVINTLHGDHVKVARGLLQHLHSIHPVQDTVVENLATLDQHWPAFRELGYIISFTRVEMELKLSSHPLNGKRANGPGVNGYPSVELDKLH